MWLQRLFDSYLAWRLRKLELISSASNAPYVAIQDIVSKQTALVEATLKSQGDFMQKWLGQFSTTDVPTSRTLRDVDEYNMEEDRLRESRTGIPGLDEAAVKIDEMLRQQFGEE